MFLFSSDRENYSDVFLHGGKDGGTQPPFLLLLAKSSEQSSLFTEHGGVLIDFRGFTPSSSSKRRHLDLLGHHWTILGAAPYTAVKNCCKKKKSQSNPSNVTSEGLGLAQRAEVC